MTETYTDGIVRRQRLRQQTSQPLREGRGKFPEIRRDGKVSITHNLIFSPNFPSILPSLCLSPCRGTGYMAVN